MIAVRWKVFGALALAAGGGFALWRSTRNPEATPREVTHRNVWSSWSHHQAPPRRSPSDSDVGHIVGKIQHEGQAVPHASIVATVFPTGEAWTTDEATSSSDGTFTIAITSGGLHRPKQRVELLVEAGDMEGRALVVLSPGETARDVTIEVGVGLTIRGRVVDTDGAPVRNFGVEPVGVRFGAAAGHPDENGAFTLTSYEPGRHRIRVVAGGISHAVSDLPLTEVAPSIVVAHLSGSIDDVVLHVDAEAARKKYDKNGQYGKEDVGTARARVVVTRGAEWPRSVGCWTEHGREDIEVGAATATVLVPIIRQAGRVMVDCEIDYFEPVVIFDPQPNQIVDFPLVHRTFDSVDLGVELRSEPDGAHVVDVADETKNAGLRRGDVVTSIDGISIANLAIFTVRELGFRLPPGQSTKLTVRRGGEQLTIELRAPN